MIHRGAGAQHVALCSTVVALLLVSLPYKERRVEADALLQVMHGDVNVKPFHWLSLSWAKEHGRVRMPAHRNSSR